MTPTSAEQPLWSELREGRGLVVLLRHARTVPGTGDPPGFQLDDCATQRNLSEEGRAQARRIGKENAMIRSWSRRLLGALFILAGLNHFVQPRFYLRMMPDYLPAHKELVAASGYAEIVLGVLAFFPRLRSLTRWGLLALLVAVFPANLNMALHPGRYPRIPPALLWLRLPLQPALMAWVWWATARAD